MIGSRRISQYRTYTTQVETSISCEGKILFGVSQRALITIKAIFILRQGMF